MTFSYFVKIFPKSAQLETKRKSSGLFKKIQWNILAIDYGYSGLSFLCPIFATFFLVLIYFLSDYQENAEEHEESIKCLSLFNLIGDIG